MQLPSSRQYLLDSGILHFNGEKAAASAAARSVTVFGYTLKLVYPRGRYSRSCSRIRGISGTSTDIPLMYAL